MLFVRSSLCPEFDSRLAAFCVSYCIVLPYRKAQGLLPNISACFVRQYRTTPYDTLLTPHCRALIAAFESQFLHPVFARKNLERTLSDVLNRTAGFHTDTTHAGKHCGERVFLNKHRVTLRDPYPKTTAPIIFSNIAHRSGTRAIFVTH